MKADDLFEQRNLFFLKMNPTTRGAVLFSMLAGLAAISAGIASGEITRVWGSLLFNMFFFFTLALGGMVFAGMQDVIGAVWARPIRRIHEAFGAFLPVAAGFFIVFLICVRFNIAHASELYSWIVKPEILHGTHGKEVWLQPGFMVARDIFAILVILFFVSWQYKHSLTKDMVYLDGKKEEAKKIAEDAKGRLRYFSAPILFIYSICFSLLGFDLLMSLSPLWFSTLWGGWLFAIMMQTLFASMLITMFIMKDTPMGNIIGRQQFHDVGKLMHGFTIFFAYLTYAHILTYWYGNVPEETEYFIERLHAPWIYIVLGAPLLNFVLPLFAMIPKASKWTKSVATPIASLILFAQWLTFCLVVMPSAGEHHGVWIPWIEFGIFLGCFSLFLSTIFWFGGRYPMVSFADPLLKQALESNH